MPESWSGRGRRFIVSVDRGSREPLHRQVELGLREAIRSGRLAPGEKLPSSRLLAEEVGVSRNLVQGCYEQLVAEGYLASRAGSATRVAERAPSSRPTETPAPAPPDHAVADFRPSVPDLASFPRQAWLRSTHEALDRLPHAELGYPDPAGSASARAALADYLRRVRAADAEPSRVVLCAGFAQGLSLAVRALVGRGYTDVAVEDPGYGPDDGLDIRSLTGAGARIHRIPVDHLGLDVDALADSPARVVVVTPAHQAPTGVPLDPTRRRALVRWAERRDGYVIEDDYDSEFRYDRQAIGALQGLAPERVFFLGTASKTLAPALRIGWVVAPAAWRADVVDAKLRDDRGSPTLHHAAFAVMVTSGRYDRHVRAMRKTYLQRRDLVRRHARRARPRRPGERDGGRPQPRRRPAAGVERGGGDGDGRRPRRRAARDEPLPGPPDHHRPRLVLGFGNTPESRIRAGLAAVADLVG